MNSPVGQVPPHSISYVNQNITTTSYTQIRTEILAKVLKFYDGNTLA